ncbi:terminase family protein [Salmonella enterica]|nr:terminase family protein [Salmonella enterica]
MQDFEALRELGKEALLNLPDDERREMLERLETYTNYYNYNRIELFKPYTYQREFMDAGKDYHIRYLRAGNRTGKTFSAAAEFTYHITGNYPEWWNGARIEGGGHTFWAVGITLDSVATVIQKELFGTQDIRAFDLVGTGTIPRENILIKKEGWESDGPRLRTCSIRHKSGRLNHLKFMGSENTDIMMGQKCQIIWIDEQPINAMDVFTKCTTRLINALGPGKSGYMMITATPERGMRDLDRHFQNDVKGELYIKPASWDDCPHFTPEMIETELAKYPKWQHEMRRRGIPVLGTGAVFDIDDDSLKLMEVSPGADWDCLAACDFGETVDASVIAVAVRNPHTDQYYLIDTFYFDKDRSPGNMANQLLAKYPGITVIRPHDHPALANQLRTFGVDVQQAPFRNPPAASLRAFKSSQETGSAIDIEVGLDEMRLMMSEGRLKILTRCKEWFKEKAEYFYDINKNTGKVKKKGADHAIDASRYAFMSLMANRGKKWAEVINKQEYWNIEAPQGLAF